MSGLAVGLLCESCGGPTTDDDRCLLDTADAHDRLVAALREALAKWSGCWCDTQMAPDHDPRVQDCPQHGDDSCRHMAEGIVVDLRALLAEHGEAS